MHILLLISFAPTNLIKITYYGKCNNENEKNH